MSSFSHKLSTFLQCAGTFAGTLDIFKYIYLKVSPFAFPKRIRIRIKELDHSLFCRTRSSDIGVLLDTIKGGHHRLPDGMSLPSNAVIMDLGVNAGYTVLDYANRHPSARIIGVEMDKGNFDLAVENTRHLGSRCTLIQAAVWTEDGKISYEGSGASAFRISSRAGSNTCTVESRSLASIFQQFGLDSIDYLKMDIEGAERQVFTASMDWAAKVRIMQVEAHSDEIMKIVTDSLTAAGFRYELVPTHDNSLLAVRRD
ncbi:MAG: FkbM family methyltransferase [Verrucomicrobia bacterium]|nr:FkbM family methyltransferase [Verrucomicrobiota bacterium]